MSLRCPRSPRVFNCSIGMRMMKYLLLTFLVVIACGGSLANRRAAAAAIAPGIVAARSSAALYSRYCASCHGRDGAANTRRGRMNHSRNLQDSEWQDRVSDERIFNSIMNGKGKMPGYGKKLSEKEIDALVTYVRGLRR
ncbi:MAG TPA: cytochrome c [Pyrinomonadaceae bacterium]|nr:cytochrome c [Pyrinomonadaceae bacterium]